MQNTLHLKNTVTSLLILCFLFICTFSVFAAQSPTEQLKPTLDKIIQILQDTSLQGDANKLERRAKIMKTVHEKFDFTEMAKRVLGKTWREISEEERVHFTSLFVNLLENNYIDRIEKYSGQAVDYTGERVKKNRALVTTVVESEGAKFPVDYVLILQDTKWKVYDINIEGVSLIRNYRAEFTSILRKDKFAGLIKILEEKNASCDK